MKHCLLINEREILICGCELQNKIKLLPAQVICEDTDNNVE
jgi:hypothetical protein